MSNEISLMLGLIIGVYFGILSGALCKRESIEVWIETATKKDILYRSFILASQLSDGAFGNRLISFRAIICSLFLSAIFFSACLWIAFDTTPGLQRIIYWQGRSSAMITLALLILEYVYVTKTRMILRVIVKDQRAPWSILTFVLIDIISTYWMFVVGFSLVLVLALYSEQIYDTSIDISTSGLVTSQVSAPRDFLLLDPYSPSGFVGVVEITVLRILQHIESGFRAFCGIEIWATAITKSGETRNGQHQLVSLATIPFTTMLASTLCTTVWISMCYIAGGTVLLFFKWWYWLGAMTRHLINPTVASAILAAGTMGALVYIAMRILLS